MLYVLFAKSRNQLVLITGVDLLDASGDLIVFEANATMRQHVAM